MANKLDETDPTHPREVQRRIAERLEWARQEAERNRLSWARGTVGSGHTPPVSDDDELA